MGLHETKKFLYIKRNGTRLNRQLTEWGKIFASYISCKGLITSIYRELKKLNFSPNEGPNEECSKHFSRTLPTSRSTKVGSPKVLLLSPKVRRSC
jgi:hypothetical protein